MKLRVEITGASRPAHTTEKYRAGNIGYEVESQMIQPVEPVILEISAIEHLEIAAVVEKFLIDNLGLEILPAGHAERVKYFEEKSKNKQLSRELEASRVEAEMKRKAYELNLDQARMEKKSLNEKAIARSEKIKELHEMIENAATLLCQLDKLMVGANFRRPNGYTSCVRRITTYAKNFLGWKQS